MGILHVPSTLNSCCKRVAAAYMTFPPHRKSKPELHQESSRAARSQLSATQGQSSGSALGLSSHRDANQYTRQQSQCLLSHTLRKKKKRNTLNHPLVPAGTYRHMEQGRGKGRSDWTTYQSRAHREECCKRLLKSYHSYPEIILDYSMRQHA